MQQRYEEGFFSSPEGFEEEERMSALDSKEERWAIQAVGSPLALELIGAVESLQVRAWWDHEAQADMIELLRTPEDSAAALVIYRGPLAGLGVVEGILPRQCPSCHHVWTPKVQDPAKCPECSYRLRIQRGQRRPGRPRKVMMTAPVVEAPTEEA